MRAVPERRDLGQIFLEAPATPEIREAVETGRRYMSVEFHSLRERTTKGGVREILRALVPDVALVADPEYDSTAAEVRRRLGPSISSTVPTGVAMDCSCPEGDCDSIEFGVDAFGDILTAARKPLATTGAMSQVVGTADLYATAVGLGIDIDLLDVAAAHDLLALVNGDVPIYARPLLDLEASITSESRRRGGTLFVRRAAFGAILVKPVAGGVSGLDPVRVNRGRPKAETRSQAILRPSRRRIWL